MKSQKSEVRSQKLNQHIPDDKSPLPPFTKGGLGGITPNSILLNEKGIALVMVLILSAIILAIMSGLVYMVISGTQISGIQKRYKTALEAGIGGADVTFQLLAARGDPFTTTTETTLNYYKASSTACLTAKLNTMTSSTNWASCSSYSNAISLTINPSDSTTYDRSFTLGSAPFQYTVYSKIVDTVEGNSGGDEGLLKTGVVTSNPGEVTVKSIPYLYTIEIDSQNTSNPAERAKLSILYQY